jgi:excisionase family DNA binding protein
MIAMATHINGKIYKTAEAAAYLGLSTHTIRKYVQRELLKPLFVVGQNYVFAKEELDRYKKERRPVGQRKGRSA